jgi:hypothetical protein
MATRATVTKLQAPAEHGNSSNDYIVPVLRIHLAEPVVKLGFYGGLAAAVVVGALDLPLAVLAGVGVAIARHRRT